MSKSKDPAFLFYSKDFYEGTRMMLPEERACYIDLLIYQHQNGIIPLDTKRMSMYCSGISEATLIAVLEAKFKQVDEGWINDKMKRIIEERSEFSSRQSFNGRIGQFWKKAKACLSAKDYRKLRDSEYANDKDLLSKEIADKDISNKATLEAMLKAMLKHLEDVNVNEDEVKDLYSKDVLIVSRFNSITGKKIQKLDKKAKSQFSARIKDGYTEDDIFKAVENCFNDKFHSDNGHKYLTMEFITRPDKLELYLNAPQIQSEEKKYTVEYVNALGKHTLLHTEAEIQNHIKSGYNRVLKKQ